VYADVMGFTNPMKDAVLQHTAKRRNTLQNTATQQHSNTLQHIATHCNTLQHTATHCNTPHPRLPSRDSPTKGAVFHRP